MENKFYTIQIAYGDKAIRGASIIGYATLKLATEAFHSTMEVNRKSPLFTHDMMRVVDSMGNEFEKDFFGEIAEDDESERYFVAELINNDVPTMGKYADENLAIAGWHGKLARASKNNKTEQVIAMDYQGNEIRSGRNDAEVTD